MPSDLNRWIGDMYGPHFLLLYASVIAVTLGFCYWRLSSRIASLSSFEATQESDFYDGVRKACLRIRMFGTAVILGLGGYKLVLAIQKGRYNVLFLVMMGIISVCILWGMRQVPPPTNRTGGR